jgi:hypothetical protein
MKFKKGMYINEQTLTSTEAAEFLLFLRKEIQRHKEHMLQYQKIAQDDNESFFMRVVALTVVSRNVDDIEHTSRTIKILEKIIGEHYPNVTNNTSNIDTTSRVRPDKRLDEYLP